MSTAPRFRWASTTTTSCADGDYVRLGEYELLVSIDKSNDFPPEESAIVAYDGQSPSSAVKKSTANDLGADLDLSQLLEPSDLSISDSGVRPRDAYGQAVLSRSDASLHLQRDPETDAGGTPWHMMTRPLKVEGRSAEAAAAPRPARRTGAARAQSPALFDGDFDVGLSAFCRGAGIDPRNIAHRGPRRGAAARRPVAARSRVGFDGSESGPQRIPQSVPHIPARQ